MTDVCLQVLGEKLYQLDDTKRMQFDLYQAYDKEIRLADITLQDMIHDRLNNFEDDVAAIMADIKDDMINPLLVQQEAILGQVIEGIVSDTLDVAIMSERMKELDARRDEVEKQLTKRIS